MRLVVSERILKRNAIQKGTQEFIRKLYKGNAIVLKETLCNVLDNDVCNKEVVVFDITEKKKTYRYDTTEKKKTYRYEEIAENINISKCLQDVRVIPNVYKMSEWQWQ